MNKRYTGIFCALLIMVNLLTAARGETGKNPAVIAVEVDGHIFTATLEENETAHAFWESLPMTVSMNELNGNEKFVDLAQGLPSEAEAVGSVEAGDLMLFGKACVVLFYEGFSTGYSYTRIGKVDDPAGLKEALGNAGVEVTFARKATE